MFIRFAVRLAVAALAAGSIILPATAAAQDIPSYARPSYASDEETVHGRIQSINGTFEIAVRDDRGFVDNVELHQGTIINPTGLTLADGMSVTILGHNVGAQFAANEIDTPYRYAGPAPSPVYYGPGWWYPGFGYGYGPSFSLAFVFGSGYVHQPFYPYYRGGPYFRDEYFAHPGYGYGYRPVIGVPRAFVGRTFAQGPGYREPLTAARSYGAESRGYGESRSYAAPSRSYARRSAGGYAPSSGYAQSGRGYAVTHSSAGAGARTTSASRGYAGGRRR